MMQLHLMVESWRQVSEDGEGREGGSAPPSPPVPSTSAAFDAAPSVNRPGRA